MKLQEEIKRNDINHGLGTEPEWGRQLTPTTFTSELILECSVSPTGIKQLGLPKIVKVELIRETKWRVYHHSQFKTFVAPQKETSYSLAVIPLPTPSPATDLLSVSIYFPILDFDMNARI